MYIVLGGVRELGVLVSRKEVGLGWVQGCSIQEVCVDRYVMEGFLFSFELGLFG